MGHGEHSKTLRLRLRAWEEKYEAECGAHGRQGRVLRSRTRLPSGGSSELPGGEKRPVSLRAAAVRALQRDAEDPPLLCRLGRQVGVRADPLDIGKLCFKFDRAADCPADPA